MNEEFLKIITEYIDNLEYIFRHEKPLQDESLNKINLDKLDPVELNRVSQNINEISSKLERTIDAIKQGIDTQTLDQSWEKIARELKDTLNQQQRLLQQQEQNTTYKIKGVETKAKLLTLLREQYERIARLQTDKVERLLPETEWRNFRECVSKTHKTIKSFWENSFTLETELIQGEVKSHEAVFRFEESLNTKELYNGKTATEISELARRLNNAKHDVSLRKDLIKAKIAYIHEQQAYLANVLKQLEAVKAHHQQVLNWQKQLGSLQANKVVEQLKTYEGQVESVRKALHQEQKFIQEETSKYIKSKHAQERTSRLQQAIEAIKKYVLQVEGNQSSFKNLVSRSFVDQQILEAHSLYGRQQNITKFERQAIEWIKFDEHGFKTNPREAFKHAPKDVLDTILRLHEEIIDPKKHNGFEPRSRYKAHYYEIAGWLDDLKSFHGERVSPYHKEGGSPVRDFIFQSNENFGVLKGYNTHLHYLAKIVQEKVNISFVNLSESQSIHQANILQSYHATEVQWRRTMAYAARHGVSPAAMLLLQTLQDIPDLGKVKHTTIERALHSQFLQIERKIGYYNYTEYNPHFGQVNNPDLLAKSEHVTPDRAQIIRWFEQKNAVAGLLYFVEKMKTKNITPQMMFYIIEQMPKELGAELIWLKQQLTTEFKQEIIKNYEGLLTVEEHHLYRKMPKKPRLWSWQNMHLAWREFATQQKPEPKTIGQEFARILEENVKSLFHELTKPKPAVSEPQNGISLSLRIQFAGKQMILGGGKYVAKGSWYFLVFQEGVILLNQYSKDQLDKKRLRNFATFVAVSHPQMWFGAAKVTEALRIPLLPRGFAWGGRVLSRIFSGGMGLVLIVYMSGNHHDELKGAMASIQEAQELCSGTFHKQLFYVVTTGLYKGVEWIGYYAKGPVEGVNEMFASIAAYINPITTAFIQEKTPVKIGKNTYAVDEFEITSFKDYEQANHQLVAVEEQLQIEHKKLRESWWPQTPETVNAALKPLQTKRDISQEMVNTRTTQLRLQDKQHITINEQNLMIRLGMVKNIKEKIAQLYQTKEAVFQAMKETTQGLIELRHGPIEEYNKLNHKLNEQKSFEEEILKNINKQKSLQNTVEQAILQDLGLNEHHKSVMIEGSHYLHRFFLEADNNIRHEYIDIAEEKTLLKQLTHSKAQFYENVFVMETIDLKNQTVALALPQSGRLLCYKEAQKKPFFVKTTEQITPEEPFVMAYDINTLYTTIATQTKIEANTLRAAIDQDKTYHVKKDNIALHLTFSQAENQLKKLEHMVMFQNDSLEHETKLATYFSQMKEIQKSLSPSKYLRAHNVSLNIQDQLAKAEHIIPITEEQTAFMYYDHTYIIKQTEDSPSQMIQIPTSDFLYAKQKNNADKVFAKFEGDKLYTFLPINHDYLAMR